LDEADQFYAGPVRWLSGNAAVVTEAQYLVFFDALLAGFPDVREWMLGQGYGEVWRAFNSHWHDDSRRVGDVVVWKREL